MPEESRWLGTCPWRPCLVPNSSLFSPFPGFCEVNVSVPQFFHHDGLTYHGPEHSKLNASGLKSSFCTYCSDEELTATVALRIPGPPIVTPLHHKESW